MSSSPQPTFTTERLWLRPLSVEDAPDIHVVRGDDEAMRWWHTGTAASLDETRAELAELVNAGTWWSFGRRGEDRAIGYAGFHGLASAAWSGFGYLLRRDEWGKGLTREASHRLLAHGFGEREIRAAELWIHPGNRQSQRVAEKLGARFRGWALTGRRTAVYGVTSDEWRGADGVPSLIATAPAIDVRDLPRAIELWCTGLGCRLDFDTGQTAQVVTAWTGGPAVRLRVGDRFDGRIVVTVGEEVDDVARRAEAVGWSLASAPADQPWGAREAVLRDPDGNTIWLAGLPRGAGTTSEVTT